LLRFSFKKILEFGHLETIRRLKEIMGVVMKRLGCCSLLLLVALTGCSLPMTRNKPTREFGKTYNIDLVQEASIGTPMITIYSKLLLPSYRIRQPYQPPELPLITPDDEWVAFHTLEDNYVVTAKRWPYRYLGVEIKKSGELSSQKPWIQVYNYKRPMQDKWEPSNPQVFLRSDGYLVHDGSFKAEFIYTGIDKGSIHISYREFSNNLIQPALQQELHYDLNKSDQITFRSLRIKVLEADNRRIKYMVLEDGGLPWVPGS
jgi:hypothetical protein